MELSTPTQFGLSATQIQQIWVESSTLKCTLLGPISGFLLGQAALPNHHHSSITPASPYRHSTGTRPALDRHSTGTRPALHRHSSDTAAALRDPRTRLRATTTPMETILGIDSRRVMAQILRMRNFQEKISVWYPPFPCPLKDPLVRQSLLYF